jgi:hypothetical protein
MAAYCAMRAADADRNAALAELQVDPGQDATGRWKRTPMNVFTPTG